MQKTCLVTGSRGFVGRSLVAALKDNDWEVIGADIETGCDVTRWEIAKELKKADCIIHLAARSYVPESFTDPRGYYEDNILSTINALELARLWKAKFIFASSYVYGQPQYLPIDEKHPLLGLNPYAQSKLLCEQLCESYSRHFKVKTIALRFFNIYGPGQSDKFLISSIALQSRRGRIVLSDPEPRRDYVHVDDVVLAYLRALEYEPEGFEVFNIGSGVSHSVREVVDLFVKFSEKKIPVQFLGKQREAEIAETRSNCQKAQQYLNWSARIDFETGLRQLAALT
ncbi:MAG: GDP-mannose 4,6-dehydratase [Thermodesulfovibrionales bacterium]|nr:GDP-mannose 4,6-dehydratase [Thermodesulfovibrionales bacterium]